MMKRIRDNKNERWIKMKSIKELTFRSAPGYKFFLHKAYKENGFTISEETTGFAVTIASSKTAAIESARKILKYIGGERFDSLVAEALKTIY